MNQISALCQDADGVELTVDGGATIRADYAVGADGLIIEVHPCPERALSDGPQSLDFAGFGKVMRSLAEPLRQTASLPAAVSAAS